MDRIRMANISDQPLNLSNEIIDLTGDSPVVNRPRFRSSRVRNAPVQQMGINLVARNSQRDDLPALISLPEPLQYDQRNNSSIQLIDPEETLFAVRSLLDEQDMRMMNSAKSNEEYVSTTVPCTLDPCNGEQIVLSCPICFEPLVAERKPMTTSCGHIFCAMCLKEYLHKTRSKTCPKCNGPVKLKSCIRLYL